MPTFMQNLMSNPGNSGVYGNPGYQRANPDEPLYLVNQLKDREMQDFKDKANFMSDLSLKQDRIKSLFSPEGVQGSQQQQPQNTVIAKDPNEMTGYEKGKLNIEQQGLGLDKQKLAQQGKLGQEALDIKTNQEKLNQQKADQLNAQKTADMERKINEANAKIEQAQAALQQRTDNAEAQIKMHRDLAGAIEERHKLEIAQRDAKFQEAQKQHEAQIKNMEERLKQSRSSKTTTEVNADGTKKTTTTEKGVSGNTIRMIGPDGSEHEVPEDKVDDAVKNYQMKPKGE